MLMSEKLFDILHQTFAVPFVVCDEIHVDNFTASIVRVMMVSDFLGEDQNADM
jgi:hypothetical protein